MGLKSGKVDNASRGSTWDWGQKLQRRLQEGMEVWEVQAWQGREQEATQEWKLGHCWGGVTGTECGLTGVLQRWCTCAWCCLVHERVCCSATCVSPVHFSPAQITGMLFADARCATDSLCTLLP